MSDLTDLKENQDPDIEFGDVVTKIEQSDPRFKRIILEYDNLPLDKKICYVIFLRSLFSTLEKAK